MTKSECFRLHIDSARHEAYERARIAGGYESRRAWILDVCDLVASSAAPDARNVKREMLDVRACVANAADRLTTAGADPGVRQAVVEELDTVRVNLSRRLRHQPPDKPPR